jgi:hypothetical protein
MLSIKKRANFNPGIGVKPRVIVLSVLQQKKHAMMIALLTWLFKKYAMPAIGRYKGNRALKLTRNAAACLLLLAHPDTASAQEQTVKYNILHSGKVVGHLDFYQKRDGESLYLKMISEVKMRFIFSIKLIAMRSLPSRVGGW